MTTLIVLLGFLAFAVAGLALGLLRLARASRSGRREAPPELALPAPPRGYGPMARLFDGRDLQFLKSQNGWRPGMAMRLRLERRAVLSLYLRQVHGDFRQCWASWRAAVAFSESPEVAPAAVKQFLAFYGLYAALRLHCLLGLLVYARTDVGSLLAVLQRLQQRVHPAAGNRPAGWPTVTAR
jgi:hypothetical protein